MSAHHRWLCQCTLCSSSSCGHTTVLTFWAVIAAHAFLHSPSSHHQWLNTLLSHTNAAAFSQAEESSSCKNYLTSLRRYAAGDPPPPFSNGVSPLLRQEARCCLQTPACQWARGGAVMYHSMLPMFPFCFFSLPPPTAQSTVFYHPWVLSWQFQTIIHSNSQIILLENNSGESCCCVCIAHILCYAAFIDTKMSLAVVLLWHFQR